MRYILLLFLIFITSSANATISPQISLTPQDQASLTTIVNKFNSISTIHSMFVQKSSNGEASQGELYLSKPGRMRIQYKPPVPVLIVADGSYFIYYDSKLKQLSHIPLDSAPAGILLKKVFSLSDTAVTVTDFQKKNGILYVTVINTKEPGEGSITLYFDEKTLNLRQWSVVDAQGVTTQVSLVNPQFNVGVDYKLFKFTDPRPAPQRR